MSADLSQLSLKIFTDRYDGGGRWMPCTLSDINTRVWPKDVQDFHLVYKGQEIDLERLLAVIEKAKKPEKPEAATANNKP